MNKMMMPAIHLAAMAAACPTNVLAMPRNEASDEAMLTLVKAELERINSDTKKTAETALSETKKYGAMAEATKNLADKLMTSQTNLSNAVTALTEKVEGVSVSSKEMAQVLAEGGRRGGSDGVMSLGRAFVEKHKEIAAYRGGTLSFDISNAITTADGSAGGLIYHEEERQPVRMPRRRLKIRSLLTQAKVGSDLVTYRTQVVRSSMAAMVAEGAASAESNFGWDKVTAPVKKIGHHINVSEESLADADFLKSELDTEMRFGLDLEEEKQILAGDGTGDNLPGMLTVAPSFVAASASLPNATHIDRLRLALLQIVLEDYIATGMILNPMDWAAIDMLKDSTGRYIFAKPEGQTTPALWGKDVIESNGQSGGEWLVGDFEMASTLYDRQETEVTMTDANDDLFIKDMVTIKARKRMVLAHKRPLAMVKGDFTFA